MLTAGIIGREGKLQTANLINAILTSSGRKISVVDSKNLLGLDMKRIKNYIKELGKNNIDILLLKISIGDIDILAVNDINFDIMIYTDKADDINSGDYKYSDVMGKAFALMAERGIAIVNVDDSTLISLLQGIKQHVVTYGFNTKASITTSSVGDTVYKDGFICCLQRTISTKSGKVIEPQEYKLNIELNGFNTHNLLAAASFAILNGVDLNDIDGF